MMRRLPILLAAVALSAVALSAVALAQAVEFPGKKPLPYIHPQGYYALQLPRSWEQALRPDGVFVAQGVRGDRAELSITMQPVTRDVDTELVALNAHRRLRELPHFRDGGGGRLTIAKKSASIRSFEFDYMGNTEYTIAVEELYIVSGTVLFLVHFEVMKRSFPRFRKDLKQIYDSLRVAEIDAAGKPIRPVKPKKKKRRTLVPDIGSTNY